MENYRDTILSQYGNSPRLLSLLESIDQWIDPSQDIDAWYDNLWNIETAQGYGLDVWGRIVGVQRTLQVSSTKYWGYAEAGTTSADPYGQSPFYNGQPLTSNYALSDTAFRTLILAKAAANISDGSIPSINQILMALFGANGRGTAWVADGLNMSLTYTFHLTPPLTPVEIAIIEQSGVFPRPPGVSQNVVQV